MLRFERVLGVVAYILTVCVQQRVQLRNEQSKCASSYKRQCLRLFHALRHQDQRYKFSPPSPLTFEQRDLKWYQLNAYLDALPGTELTEQFANAVSFSFVEPTSTSTRTASALLFKDHWHILYSQREHHNQHSLFIQL